MIVKVPSVTPGENQGAGQTSGFRADTPRYRGIQALVKLEDVGGAYRA
jgi:hypothetical protein